MKILPEFCIINFLAFLLRPAVFDVEFGLHPGGECLKVKRTGHIKTPPLNIKGNTNSSIKTSVVSNQEYRYYIPIYFRWLTGALKLVPGCIIIFDYYKNNKKHYY